MGCDTKKYAMFFNEMLERGILFPPAQFEGLFLSTEHTEEDIDITLKAADEALKIVFNI